MRTRLGPIGPDATTQRMPTRLDRYQFYLTFNIHTIHEPTKMFLCGTYTNYMKNTLAESLPQHKTIP
jgi:hypothetical protein